MEKQREQDRADLEMKRLCGVFGSPQPPEEEKPLDGKAITGGSWAELDVTTLTDEAAIRTAARQLKQQGADYALVTLKDAAGTCIMLPAWQLLPRASPKTRWMRPISPPSCGKRASSRRHSLPPLPTRCRCTPTAAWACTTMATASGWTTSAQPRAARHG